MIMLMRNVELMTSWVWMCLVYGDFKGALSVSSSMECYFYIAQVWLKVILDDGLYVVIMSYVMMCLLWMNVDEVGKDACEFTFRDL